MQAFAFNTCDAANSVMRGCGERSTSPSTLKRSTASSSTISTNGSPATSRAPIWPRAAYRPSRNSRFCIHCGRRFPPEVFTTPYWNPVARDQGATRRQSAGGDAAVQRGWIRGRDFALVDRETGKPMQVEFLVDDPGLERVVLFYRPSLQRLGITADVRLVDDVQYINRLRDWDFDIIVATWGEALTPGNEQRDYWGSSAADIPGSRNLRGIKNPAVDALIDSLVRATTRDQLVAATRALDRVLLWNHYVVPQWTLGKVRPRVGPLRAPAPYAPIWSDRFSDLVVVGCAPGGANGREVNREAVSRPANPYQNVIFGNGNPVLRFRYLPNRCHRHTASNGGNAGMSRNGRLPRSRTVNRVLPLLAAVLELAAPVLSPDHQLHRSCPARPSRPPDELRDARGACGA